MDLISNLFEMAPFIALFITLSLGYMVGKITIGRFVLGGVAGTLLMGVIIGQFGVNIDPGVKSIFFALFIYAVGYQGGAKFFKALNFRTINILLSAVVMTVSGLLCVLAAAYMFDLDRGTAAGLAAGGLTQSAIIGTAGDAIARLGVSEEAQHIMQTNVAVGYAVTYIFGSLGPILMVTWVFPTLMKWDIRAEAIKLEKESSDGKHELAPGEFNALTSLVTRAYSITKDSSINGKTIGQLNQNSLQACIELAERDGKPLELDKFTALREGDLIIITGRRNAVHEIQQQNIGAEVSLPENYEIIEENRQLIADNHSIIGKSVRQIKEQTNKDTYRGVYVTEYIREGAPIEVTPDLIVKKNDIIQLTGTAEDINRVENNIGKRLGSATITDFIIFGLGMVAGFLIGLINFKIAGIPVTIGSGAGCLVSGLVVGWLRSKNPHVAQFPEGAANFIRDFGLAAFVGIVGLQAGPQAVETIKEHGMTLLFLGMAVTIIPQIISFFFSYFVLRIKNPVEALGCVTGGRSANPAFAALMEKTGNATPVFSFTVTYAVANVLLTLWGPIIVGVITLNAGM